MSMYIILKTFMCINYKYIHMIHTIHIPQHGRILKYRYTHALIIHIPTIKNFQKIISCISERILVYTCVLLDGIKLFTLSLFIYVYPYKHIFHEFVFIDRFLAEILNV